jgi:copper chaperone CopZ
MSVHRRRFLAAMALVPWTLSTLTAAETKVTAIYVKDMHCQTCAKKIAGKLYEVPGVVKVSTNFQKGVAVIVPQASKQPSPKALWEAVEAAKFQPTRIASPLGNFTKKPPR